MPIPPGFKYVANACAEARALGGNNKPHDHATPVKIKTAKNSFTYDHFSKTAETADIESAVVIPFILDKLEAHRAKSKAPFFVGINGVQGSGKTTLVEALHKTLSDTPYSLSTLSFSIDDLYLPRAEQAELATSHSTNPLVQHRGQPSTHDLPLGSSLFRKLKSQDRNIQIPSYDKSAFNGQGDRRPRSEWKTVNSTSQDDRIEVILFEGWCVGFRSLSDEDLETKWQSACAAANNQKGECQGRLGKHKREDVKFVNDALKKYDEMTDYLDTFVHLDAEDPLYVYGWRQEQEESMRESKGTGMTEQQVTNFVNGYYPAYELYTDALRAGVFPNEKNRQLRLVLDRDRRMKEAHIV